jgi:hypothetical protein
MLLFYLLAFYGLWYAPIYVWLLLVKGWGCRRLRAPRTVLMRRVTVARDVALDVRTNAEWFHPGP